MIHGGSRAWCVSCLTSRAGRTAARWQARFRDPVTDRQHSKNFDRKVDAEAWLNEQISATVTGRYVDPKSGKVSLQVYYDDWKERQLWKASTRENADLAVGCCTFKETPLNAVRRSHVAAWVKAMDATLAASTIDTRVTIVRGILRAAVADRLIAVRGPRRAPLASQRRRVALASNQD